MRTTMIEVSGLTKTFRHQKALDGIDFNVSAGQIFGFLGPSGSGKNTTINILTGQLKADSGQAFLLGKSSDSLKPEDFRQIGMMGDGLGAYDKMTVWDNLSFFARFHQQSFSVLESLLKQLELYDARDTKVEKLSTGMKQRLYLIRSLLHQPKVLFLDEPTSGMDPTLSRKVHALLLDLKHKGVTIFLTTHDMEEATKLCDEVALLHQGQIVERGTPTEIVSRYSQEEMVELTYQNGRKKLVSRSELSNHISEYVTSIHTVTATLEDVFIQLTGEQLDV